MTALAVSFDLEPAGPVDDSTLAQMGERGALCLVDAAGDGAWLLPKAGVFDGVRALDGAWLEHALRDVDGRRQLPARRRPRARRGPIRGRRRPAC